jgi:hypothetical protein
MSDSNNYPPCGMYRTGSALKSDPERIPSGILVYFHNHSDQGIPFLQLPEDNVHNVWSFQEFGPGIENDDQFLNSMQPLKEQGFYYLTENLQTPDREYNAYTLVQLGYNRDGDPILFPAQRSEARNALAFSESGYRFESLDILEALAPDEPMDFIEMVDAEDYEGPFLGSEDPTGVLQ